MNPEQSESTTVIKAAGVGLTYFDGDSRTDALSDVTLELPRAGFIGVMGPSGSGKSSLLYVLSGLKRPSRGEINYCGESLVRCPDRRLTRLRRANFGFVFQQPWLLGWQTAAENALNGAPVVNTESRQQASDLFAQLGLEQLAGKTPSQLSGGEKQRVCVVRAMMNNPKVIFADEPTASLDHRNGHLVVDILASYRDKGLVIVVTHDPEMLQGADKVLNMRDGQTTGWTNPVSSRDLGPS